MKEQPFRPREIQITVDGDVVHTFVAEEIAITESRDKLLLSARRWEPSITAKVPDAVLGPTGTPLDGFFTTLD